MNGKKSHKGRREYKIDRATDARAMAEMDAEGWKREHIQFREDGKLDIVYSRVVREEKPIDPVTKVLVAVGEKINGDSSTIVNLPVDERKGLFDKRTADAFDENKLIRIDKPKIQREGQAVDKIIAQLDADSMERAIETGNEFYQRIKERYPTLSFTEWQNLQTVAS